MDKTAYRVEIQNKFAAIDIDDDAGDDPLEKLKKLKEQEALAKKNVTAAQKTAQVKKPIPAEVALKNEKNEKNVTQVSAKPFAPRFTSNQTNKFAPNRPPRTEAGTDSEVKNTTSWNNDGKPREDRPFRGRGGFRRGRGGFRRGPEENTGKREFDRHSGNEKSGVKPHEKREGGGAHNWGSIRDNINEQIGENAVTQETSSSQDDLTKNETTKATDAPVEVVEEKAPEPEEKQFTLDEWKKMQELSRMKANFNVRKANEGCQDPKWNSMVALKKTVEEEEADEEGEEEVDEKKQASKVDIKITFGEARRGTRGRGGVSRRSVNPERKGSNYERKTEAKAPVPNVADEIDFPSLS